MTEYMFDILEYNRILGKLDIKDREFFISEYNLIIKMESSENRDKLIRKLVESLQELEKEVL